MVCIFDSCVVPYSVFLYSMCILHIIVYTTNYVMMYGIILLCTFYSALLLHLSICIPTYRLEGRVGRAAIL